MKVLSEKEIHEYLDRCVNLPVSDTWRGYGTAIFLELGNLRRHTNPEKYQSKGQGDITVMIEWSWRIEGQRSIIVGSFDTNKIMDNKIKTIIDRKVEKIAVIGKLPELYIQLSGNRWLHSFATEAGQPQWGVIFRNEGCLKVMRGKVYFEADENKKNGITWR